MWDNKRYKSSWVVKLSTGFAEVLLPFAIPVGCDYVVAIPYRTGNAMKPNTQLKLVLLHDVLRHPGCNINEHDDARLAIDLMDGGLLKGFADTSTDPPSARRLYVTRAGEVAIKEYTPSLRRTLRLFFCYNLTVAIIALVVGIAIGIEIVRYIDDGGSLALFFR